MNATTASIHKGLSESLSALQLKSEKSHYVKPRVLIADDDDSILSLLGALLAGSFDVVKVRDGREGETLITSLGFVPDLMITDLSMPHADGLTLINALHSHDTTRHVPVILMSGSGMIALPADVPGKGSVQYISKPFDPRMILSSAYQLTGSMKIPPYMPSSTSTKRIYLRKKEPVIPGKIQSAINMVIHECAEGISRSAIAKRLAINPDFLSREFHRLTGKNLHHFITEFRLSNAMYHLSHTEKKIITVCFDAGFGSLRSFNRIFLEFTGMTPTAYRDYFQNSSSTL